MKLLTAGFFLLPVDAPRYGRERFGIGPGGPMDTRALRLNQLLLGNSEDDRALEMAGPLPSFHFEEAVSVAVTGKPVRIFLDGQPLAMRRSFNVRPGSALTFERIEAGGWTYLGVAGGIEGIANGEVQLKAPRFNDWSAFLPETLYCERRKRNRYGSSRVRSGIGLTHERGGRFLSRVIKSTRSTAWVAG